MFKLREILHFSYKGLEYLVTELRYIIFLFIYNGLVYRLYIAVINLIYSLNMQLGMTDETGCTTHLVYYNKKDISTIIINYTSEVVWLIYQAFKVLIVGTDASVLVWHFQIMQENSNISVASRAR